MTQQFFHAPQIVVTTNICVTAVLNKLMTSLLSHGHMNNKLSFKNYLLYNYKKIHSILVLKAFFALWGRQHICYQKNYNKHLFFGCLFYTKHLWQLLKQLLKSQDYCVLHPTLRWMNEYIFTMILHLNPMTHQTLTKPIDVQCLSHLVQDLLNQAYYQEKIRTYHEFFYSTWGLVCSTRPYYHLGKCDFRCSFRAGTVGSSLWHTWQRRGSFNSSLVPSLTVTLPSASSIWMTSVCKVRSAVMDMFLVKDLKRHKEICSHHETRWNNQLWRSSSVFCSSNKESQSLGWLRGDEHDLKENTGKLVSWVWCVFINNLLFVHKPVVIYCLKTIIIIIIII